MDKGKFKILQNVCVEEICIQLSVCLSVCLSAYLHACVYARCRVVTID